MMKLSDILSRNKEQIVIEDSMKYKQVTVRMWNKGVRLRNEIYGSDIKSPKRFLVSKGQFIISKIDARHGAFGMIPEELAGAVITADFLSYNINSSIIIPEYFHWFFSQKKFIEFCSKASSGTTNRIRLREDKFLDIDIEIPSIEEQRIRLCKIESINTSNIEFGDNMRKNEKLVSKLRQAILSEAVQGKLVPQDPNDEPASVLLKKIKAEKEKLIKEKKIRKEKSLPPVSEDEIPYKLPKNWDRSRVGEILTFNYGKGIDKDKIGGNIPAYGANGILKHLTESLITGRCLVVGRKGSAGEITIVNEPCWPSDVTYYIEEYSNLDFNFMYYLLKSLNLQKLAYGIKPGLNRNDAYKIIIGLPPLAEQKRIATEVDKLMQLCDQLEEQVRVNQKNSETLMNSVLREAFEAEV